MSKCCTGSNAVKLPTQIFTGNRLHALLARAAFVLRYLTNERGVSPCRPASTNRRGKRGGSRVIYYHFVSASQIALLLIYPKNEQDDLTAEQRKALKSIIETWR